MRSVSTFGLLLCAFAFVLPGCGAKQEAGDAQTSTPPASSPPVAATVTLPAGLDDGPRAGESALDEAQAKNGERLFQTKGCSACHAFGKRVTGPDLAGVSKRRTQAWLEYQILHPDVMIKQDPIARDLFAQFSLQMPKQGLTPEEARAVIEYLKYKDHEAGEGR